MAPGPGREVRARRPRAGRRRQGRPRRLPGERALDPRGGAESRTGALARSATRASGAGHPGGPGVRHAGSGAAPVRPVRDRPPHRRAERARPAHRPEHARRWWRSGRRERGRPALGARAGGDARGPQQLDHAAGPGGGPAPARRGPATRQRRRPVRLGALARAVRPHRRLPAPPQHPLRRHAHHRRPPHRHRPHRARDDGEPRRRPVRQARRRDHEADQARPARARHARPPSTSASSSSSTTAPCASTSTTSRRRSPRCSRCSRRPTPWACSRSRAGPRCRRCPSRGPRASTTSWWRSRSSGRAPSRATPSTPTCAASRASSPSPTSIPAWRRSCATPWA